MLAEQLLELFERLDLSRFEFGQFDSDHGRDGTDFNDVGGRLAEVDERSGDKDEEWASDISPRSVCYAEKRRRRTLRVS